MELLDWKVYAINGLIAGIILTVIALVVNASVKTRHPGKFQVAIELLLDTMRDFFSAALGQGGARHIPLVMTFFLYILVCDLMGLIPGLHSATAATSTTIALGLIAFFYIQYQGIKSNGLLGYLRHFAGPILFLAPVFIVIEVIGELAKPFSLGMRLFGNIYGEDVINDLAVKSSQGFLHGIIPIQLPVYFLQTFTDLIQPFIFALLTAAYISIFTSSHHQDDAQISHEYENDGDVKGRIPAEFSNSH